MPEPATVRAAGAVLWRPGPRGAATPQVALVHRPRYGDWSFPKGKCLPGEHVLLTAVREVEEETGVQVLLGRRLSTARYATGDGLPKRVDYWAARPAGCADAPGEFVPGAEVDDLVWLPVERARARLTYPHDVAVLDGFATGPADTTALILARHAVARGKKAWREAGHVDLARPLTTRGRAQARALAGLLGCFGPVRVVSSGAERCLATVRPYAQRTGARLETEPAFTLPQPPPGRVGEAGQNEAGQNEAGQQDQAARERIGEVIAAGVPAVICAHRENLPPLLAFACERLRAPVPGGPPLRTGGLWVLHVGDGRLVSAEQHHTGGDGAAGADPPG